VDVRAHGKYVNWYLQYDIKKFLFSSGGIKMLVISSFDANYNSDCMMDHDTAILVVSCKMQGAARRG
jgi:hypothetical protein